MRIRRRPQAPSLPLLHQTASASDPPTSASSPSQTPRNAAAAARCGGEGDDDPPHADADLAGQVEPSGAARRLALLPQEEEDGAVDSGAGVGAAGRQGVGGGDAHMRCSTVVENGHHHGWDRKDSATCSDGAVADSRGKPTQPPAAVAAKVEEEEHATSNGPSVDALKKVISNGGSNKRRRGQPGVLLEGSRCSRVNGRGWRCSQPTLVGYSLCEHHLGKGRARAGSGAGGGTRGGPGQLGRTQRSRAKVVVAGVLPASAEAAVTVATAATTEGGQAMPRC